MAGVVDAVVEATTDELSVEDDLRRDTALPLGLGLGLGIGLGLPFWPWAWAWPLACGWCECFSSVLMLVLLFLRRLLRKEGITGNAERAQSVQLGPHRRGARQAAGWRWSGRPSIQAAAGDA